MEVMMSTTNEETFPVTEATNVRVLNVEIAERAYWHVRKCAAESRMSLKQFMTEFCLSAKPIITDASLPADASTTVHAVSEQPEE